MFTYAQYLFRSQRYTRPDKSLQKLKKVIAQANLANVINPTSPQDLLKSQAGLIAFRFFNQPHHQIQSYNDFELTAFNVFKARGFNTQGVFNLVKDNFWNNDDIQRIIEGARKLTVDYSSLTSFNLQTKLSGGDQYAPFFNAATFNDATTNSGRQLAVQSL
jgi:hypothetical protein